MERHASYALVGIISMALLIIGIVFVVWLGGTRFGASDDPYRVIFTGPVRGLSVGGEVQLNGIKVGQIERIQLDEQDSNRVITDIILTRGTPVRTDSIASTESLGISGVSLIQISAGTPSQPMLRKSSREARPVIRSKANSISALLQGGNQMIESATSALDRVNRLLSDDNIRTVGQVVRDVQLTSGELAANRAMFSHAASMLAKLDRAADNITAATASIRNITDSDGKQTLGDISGAARELKEAIVQARGTITNINVQTQTLGATTLPQISATMQSLQNTSDSLDGLIRQIRQNPRQTLLRKGGKELELPQ